MPTLGISFIGRERDAGSGSERWEKFRPSVAFGTQHDVGLDALYLLYIEASPERSIGKRVCEDIEEVRGAQGAPPLPIALSLCPFEGSPFDLDACLHALRKVVETRAADCGPDGVELAVNMNTGTHAMMLAAYILSFTGLGALPVKLVQVAPGPQPGERTKNTHGARARYLNLDLSSYAEVKALSKVKFDELHARHIASRTHQPELQSMWSEMFQVGIHTDDPILILGPTGAGKSWIARQLHEARGARGGFHALNCAGLPRELTESLLFGHVKGAFTGATSDHSGMLVHAKGGTLFLDEVGDLDLVVQAKLLKAIEEKVVTPLGATDSIETDFRLISATNVDLDTKMAEGLFRADLYARISCWQFTIPGLAERRADIPLLFAQELSAWHEQRAQRGEIVRVTFSDRARRAFLDFATSPAALWPGNLRDLRDTINRMARRALFASQGASAVIECEGVQHAIDELRARWRGPAPNSRAVDRFVEYLAILEGPSDLMGRAEAAMHEWALQQCGQNKAAAGKLLYARGRDDSRNFTDTFNRRAAILHGTGAPATHSPASAPERTRS